MTGFHRGAIVAVRICHDEEVQLGKTSWQMPRHDRFLESLHHRGTWQQKGKFMAIMKGRVMAGIRSTLEDGSRAHVTLYRGTGSEGCS